MHADELREFVPESSARDEIARLAAHLDAATHRLLTCIRVFDDSGDWHREGAISCAHWLTWRIGLDPGTAREKVRVARALGRLPTIDDALRRGELSYAKVRALTRVATPENEPMLLELARYTTGAQLERLCRKLRFVSHLDDEGAPLDRLRTVREQPLENGLVRVTIVLHADEAALLMKAIDEARVSAPGAAAETSGGARTARDASAETQPAAPTLRAASAQSPSPTPPVRPLPPLAGEGRGEGLPVSAETRPTLPTRADALMTVVDTYLAHRHAIAPSSPRTHLVVHLDHDALTPAGRLAATLDDGTRVSAEAFRRLTCDTTLTPLHHTADDHTTAASRTRIISPHLRRLLSLRDRTCRFPACPNTLFLHAHHIHHWSHGGETTPENLVLLCTHHHRLVHEGGIDVTRTPAGMLHFTDSAGRLLEEAAQTWRGEGDDGLVGAAAVMTWAEDAGLQIDLETNLCAWDGEPVAYEEVVNAVVAAGALRVPDLG